MENSKHFVRRNSLGDSLNTTSSTNQQRAIRRNSTKFESQNSLPSYPELQHNLTAIAAQLTSYNEELQQRNSEKEELQKLVKRLKSEIANAKSLIHKLQLSADSASNEVNNYKSKLATIQEENALYPNEIKKIAKEIEEVCNYCIFLILRLLYNETNTGMKQTELLKK